MIRIFITTIAILGIQAQYVYLGASDEIQVATNIGVLDYDGYIKITADPNGAVWAPSVDTTILVIGAPHPTLGGHIF